MSKRLAGVVIVCATLSACAGERSPTDRATSGAQPSEATTTAEIEALLNQYVRAVNDADKGRLREIWTEDDEVSFVNPRARLRSWKELEGFWDDVLQASYSKRELKPNNVTIHAVGNVGWAVFDWEFNATRTDGREHRARGWETQVLRKSDRGWRIAHVHISVPVEPPPGTAR